MIIDAHAHVFPERIAKRATDAVFEFYGFAKPDEERGTAALLTEQLNPGTDRIKQHLLDKHYFRKHGKNAYYGQNN